MSDVSPARQAAMVEFLGTFPHLTPSPTSLTDLSDGVLLFEALAEIAPDYFDPTTIAHNLGDNWALKASNVRKLLRNLELYFQHECHQTAPFMSLNVSAMTRDQNVTIIATLVEWVVAAAVMGTDKSTYISRIMSLSVEGQMEMKLVIEAGMASLESFEPSEDVDENELVFGDGDENADMLGSSSMDVQEMDAAGGATKPSTLFASHANEEALQNAHREIAQLQVRQASLQQDHDEAQQKLQTLLADAQSRLHQKQDDLLSVEEDLRATQTELNDVKAQLATSRESKTQLADDLEIAQHKAAQLAKAEAQVTAYKKKIENLGTMSSQVTELEEQATSYLGKIAELEAELKKGVMLQKRVHELQDELERLQHEQTRSVASTSSTASELVTLRTQLAQAERSTKQYKDELAETQAQLSVAQEQVESHNAAPAGPPPEEVARLQRLEAQNETLQQQLTDLEAARQAAEDKAASAAQEAATAVAQAEAALASAAPPMDHGTQLATVEQEVKRLQEALANKEAENTKIASDKDKLEAYTKRTLAKFQDKYLVALQECKAKMKEKQDKIEVLEQRSANERTAQKREERLLSSTIYELGLGMMQQKLKER